MRTRDDHDLEVLQRAGATEVVPEAIEGSLMLASHALALLGVPMQRVIRVIQDQREQRYSLLRGFFRGADDGDSDEAQAERLQSVTLPATAGVLGHTLAQINLAELSVRLVSLRRNDGKAVDIASNPVLQEGDTLVMSGKAEPLAKAQTRLLHVKERRGSAAR